MNAARQGFTLTELLITMAIGGAILTAVLQLVFSAQRLYQTDTARSAVNQDAGVAITAMTNELRQAGERLTRDFPALSIDGAPGAERVTVRRSLLDAVLPVCKDIKGGSNANVVFVSKKGGPSGKYPDTCKDTSTEVGFNDWISYRKAQGGSVPVYIFDPVTGLGELFDYAAEDSSGQHIHRESGKWEHDYPVENNPRLYMLEQLIYQQSGSFITRQAGDEPAVEFLPGVTSFDLRPIIVSGGKETVVTGAFPAAPLSWKDLLRLDVSVTAQQQVGGRSVARTFTSSFVPRNVFSEDR